MSLKDVQSWLYTAQLRQSALKQSRPKITEQLTTEESKQSTLFPSDGLS
jgi:hypothetical protein